MVKNNGNKTTNKVYAEYIPQELNQKSEINWKSFR